MAFFDLNIPIEQEQRDKNKAKTIKNSRVKVVVKAMELGYSGIAYNRFVSGIIVDSDRSAINIFPLSSLLDASPALAETVRFHREVLGVPAGEKFRQYSRITVAVDTMLQAASVNPNNTVLRTYDLVAVHPMNPTIFEHACLKMEVDLISIDFSRQLPFRLKSSLIRAAVQRGVFFEVMYSLAISNLCARREMFKQVQVLVEWTHGRNIIVSSAASNVNELRGPNDVVNMSTLFGLSTEHAKAAISKNCRSLILHGLTRKNCYKLAIEVKNQPPDGIVGSDKAWFDVSEIWDPISSGEGDVVLKANLVASRQLYSEKGSPPRSKKRRRRSGKSVSISSSQNNGVLPHQNNMVMEVDPGTSVGGLKLNESKFSLDTRIATNPNTNIAVLDSDTCMKEQKSRREKTSVPQATPDGNNKFPSTLELMPLDGNTHQVKGNGIWGTLFQTDDKITDRITQVTKHKSNTNKNTESSIVTTAGDNEFSFSRSMEFLPLDDNTQQVMADGIGGTSFQTDDALVDSISQVTEYKNMQSSIVNCDVNIGPSPSFTSDKCPMINGVLEDALEVGKESLLPSDASRDSIIIGIDSLCNNRGVSELRPHNRTVGVEVEQADTVVLGSDIEMDGLKLRANEKHITEPNMEKGILVSYDVFAEDPMPTMGVEELSGTCANYDVQMELNPKTGREGKLRRKKPNSIPTLPLQGTLKSGLFKKKVQFRKKKTFKK